MMLLLQALVSTVLLLTAVATTNDDECPCASLQRPNLRYKEETARWMMHSLHWGVLSTISTRLPGLMPFGNVYSFVDGSCNESTGIIYIYGTNMDQSFKDVKDNKAVSMTLSEASLANCNDGPLKMCRTVGFGDPENPLCARLTISGQLEVLEADDDELAFARDALFERHPSMEKWPKGHEWLVAKIVPTDLWLIDYFGGASILDIDKYFNVDMASMVKDDAEEEIAGRR